MPDIRGLVMDPEFEKFPMEERVAALQKVGASPDFIEEYKSMKGASAVPATSTPMDSGGDFLDKVKTGIRTALQTKVPNAALYATGVLAPPLSVVTGATMLGGGTPEGLAEFLPGAGAMAGAALGGGVPGGVAGAAGGELLRQGVRRSAGLPAATGLAQRLLELDPNSLAASASGVGMEAATVPVAEGVSGAVKGLANVADNWSLRWLVNLLGKMNPREEDSALDLARRMRTEGVAPPLSTRGAQIANADKVLAGARTGAAEAADAARAIGERVPTSVPTATMVENIPPILPSGAMPQTARAERNAALRVAHDAVGALGLSDASFDEAVAQKRFWDDMYEEVYAKGRTSTPSKELQKVNNMADSWRAAANDTFPDYGMKNKKLSDMITVTKLLKDSMKDIKSRPILSDVHSIKGLLYRPIKAMLNNGPVASLGSGVLDLMSQILAGGAESAEAWVRVADPFNAQLANVNPTSRGLAPSEETPDMFETLKKLRVSGQPPAPSASPRPPITEQEFLQKYQ